MPMPTTIEMNITEKSERCPMTRVATPMDQHRLTVRMVSISRGLPTRMKARSSRASVRANERMVACSLSRKAAVISSLDRAGLPVTPTCTLGKSPLREATTVARMPSMACPVVE